MIGKVTIRNGYVILSRNFFLIIFRLSHVFSTRLRNFYFVSILNYPLTFWQGAADKYVYFYSPYRVKEFSLKIRILNSQGHFMFIEIL